MSDARRYAVWPEPRSRSRSLKGSRPSVPHGTNFFYFVTFLRFFIFFWNVFTSMIWHRTTKSGEGRISKGSATPHRKGADPAFSDFLGSLLFLHTPFDAEVPNLTCSHLQLGRGGLFFRGQPWPVSKGRSPRVLRFLGLGSHLSVTTTTMCAYACWLQLWAQ